MLHTDFRPPDFNAFVGNSSLKSSLRAILKRKPKDRPHTFMFYGPSGCGKTTVGRILGEAFGALPENIMEMNAANTNGINTVREIVQLSGTPPFGGEAKVFILDESHELRKQAQEAFLKDTEDVPDWCYFIFCTTNPESFIEPLYRRCSRYQVKILSSSELMELLLYVCNKKDLEVSTKVLKCISRRSDGRPRDALVKLDQVRELEEQAALELVDVAEGVSEDVWDLCNALAQAPSRRKKNWRDIMDVAECLNEGPETVRQAVLREMLKKLHNTDSSEDAQDMLQIIEYFNTPFYGGKHQLLIAVGKSCFMSE